MCSRNTVNLATAVKKGSGWIAHHGWRVQPATLRNTYKRHKTAKICENTVSATCVQRNENDLQISKRNLCKKVMAVALSLYTAELAKNTKLGERENGKRENACMRWQKISN